MNEQQPPSKERSHKLRIHLRVPSADITVNEVLCGSPATWTYVTQEVAAVTCKTCLRLHAQRTTQEPCPAHSHPGCPHCHPGKTVPELSEQYVAACESGVWKTYIDGLAKIVRAAQPPSSEDAKDAARYRWLRGRVLGSEYRRIGLFYSEPSDIDAQIDRILTYSGTTKEVQHE